MDETSAKMFDRVKSVLMSSLGYIGVGLTSIVYVLMAFVTIDKTGKTGGEIIATGVISFIFGILVNRSFSMQGIMNGSKDSRIVEATKAHQVAVDTVADQLDRLQPWCEEENKRNYKVQRTKILARGSMRYDDCFDEEGIAKPCPLDLDYKNKPRQVRNVIRQQYRYWHKAVTLHLTPLNASDLTSDKTKKDDIYYMGRTKVEYERSTFLQTVLTKVGTAILFGYYGVKIIENFDYRNLIWTSLQVGVYIMFGVISMFQAYNYMTDEYRCRLEMKADELKKFNLYIEKEGRADGKNDDARTDDTTGG